MNIAHSDFLYKLNNQKIEKDRAFIVKEETLKPVRGFGAVLNQLGNWMVAKGEQLRRRNTASKNNATLVVLQDNAGIFRA